MSLTNTPHIRSLVYLLYYNKQLLFIGILCFVTAYGLDYDSLIATFENVALSPIDNKHQAQTFKTE